MKKQFNHKDGSESSKFRGKSQYNKYDKKTKTLSCFECGETDHLVKDCPQKKKSQFKRGDRTKKKAMVAAWSDSESSSDSDSDDEKGKTCLMASKDESHDEKLEVTMKELMASPKEVLFEFLSNMISNEEKLIAQTNKLIEKATDQEKTIMDLSQKVARLETSFLALDIKVKTLDMEKSVIKTDLSSLRSEHHNLENEKISLNKKIQDQQTTLISFTKSKGNLDRMLGE